jgi:amino acid transporter
VVMWNYSGWDTPSTCLGEAKTPEHGFRRALFVALPVIVASYVLPAGVLLASGATDWTKWTTGSLPALTREAIGPRLGDAVAAGAVLSAAGLFMSLLLTNSRLPYVMARDGLMPGGLATIHPRFGTPWAAVVLSAALYAALAVFSFKELIVLNVWLYSLSLLIELAAFVWLRVREPALPRPWRVPGGLAAASAVALIPALLSLLAMATAGWLNTLAGVVAALTGPAAYVWLARAARPDSPR